MKEACSQKHLEEISPRNQKEKRCNPECLLKKIKRLIEKFQYKKQIKDGQPLEDHTETTSQDSVTPLMETRHQINDRTQLYDELLTFFIKEHKKMNKGMGRLLRPKEENNRNKAKFWLA